MIKEYEFSVAEDNVGKRLDVVISDVTKVTRSAIKTNLKSILINGKIAKLSYKCRINELVQIVLEWPDIDILPEDIPLDIVYEDDKVLVFPPLQPVNAGHMLIIPKKHTPYLTDLDERTNLHIIKIARKASTAIRKSKYKCEGINWFLADGEAAHQEVFHFHFHVYPRFKGDGFGFKYDKKKNFIRMERSKLDKIAKDLKNLL